MIKKERTFPRDIKVLQALKRRLVDNHPQSAAVNDQLKLRLTGFKGELSLNYPLTFLPDDSYIFHDLRLYDGTHHFQIDCLVVTASLLIIIEVKNIGGELFFNQRFHYLERKWEEDHSTFGRSSHSGRPSHPAASEAAESLADSSCSNLWTGRQQPPCGKD